MNHLQAAATRKGHLVGWRAIQEFLATPGPQGIGFLRHTWSPLSPSPDRRQEDLMWTAFLVWLHHSRGVKCETAVKYLGGCGSVLESLDNPVDFGSFPVLSRYKKAWRKQEAKCTTPVAKAKASIDMVRRITSDPRIPAPVRAAIMLAFHSLARVGEIVYGIRWSDVQKGTLVTKILLLSSKTDPFRRGQFLVLPTSVWDDVVTILAPPSMKGNVFGDISRKDIVLALGGQGHSLRRGGAQFLWDSGFSLDAIKRRGRWRSDAWQAYIDTSVSDVLGQQRTFL